MIRLLVWIKRGSEGISNIDSINNIGDRDFNVMPRVGEYVCIEDENNEEMIFKVCLVVIFSSEKSKTAKRAGELCVKPVTSYEDGLEAHCPDLQ